MMLLMMTVTTLVTATVNHQPTAMARRPTTATFPMIRTRRRVRWKRQPAATTRLEAAVLGPASAVPAGDDRWPTAGAVPDVTKETAVLRRVDNSSRRDRQPVRDVGRARPAESAEAAARSSRSRCRSVARRETD